MTSSTRNRAIGVSLATAIFLADQAIKAAMVGPLQLAQRGMIEVMPLFRFTWAENRGVSLGMLTADSEQARWLLVALTAAIALFVAVWLLREKALGEIVGLGLVLGGALGNIRDRAVLGYVVDYADLHFGEWRPFLIFNLGDAAITFGVLIILARSFLSREKPPHTIPAVDTAPES